MVEVMSKETSHWWWFYSHNKGSKRSPWLQSTLAGKFLLPPFLVWCLLFLSFFERDVYSFFVCESWPWFLVLHLLVLLLDSWPLESVALNILESLNCFHFTVTFYNNWLTSEHNWCRLFVTFDLVDYLYGHKQLLEMWGEFKQKLKRE